LEGEIWGVILVELEKDAYGEMGRGSQHKKRAVDQGD